METKSVQESEQTLTLQEDSLLAHRNLRGKIAIESKVPLDSRQDLSTYYSPGVGAVASLLAKKPQQTPIYTWTNNSVAVVSDGSAVLGLGNIGPYGALPVMEGKAMLFKSFAGIDAVPIVLGTQDPDEIIAAVEAIAPGFGGINLEDIAAPKCFYIEDTLRKRLAQPLMHDDQHGTAVVVLAGLQNAARVIGKRLQSLRVVIIGAGAAGSASAHLLHKAGLTDIVTVDTHGAIYDGRSDLNASKQSLALINTHKRTGALADVMRDADAVIGVSKAGVLSEKLIATMAADPIVFALANPDPEIYPDRAKAAGAAIVATGRSDFPNQINNVLAFPGLFRGALDTQSPITDQHKLDAAEAISRIVRNPNRDNIVPEALNRHVMPAVASVFR